VLEGAFNFRDVGGYPAAGGRRTRAGRVYRSDTLAELTDADVDRLHDLGVATVVDLRTGEEVTRDGSNRLDPARVATTHLSILATESGESRAAPPEEDGLAARYLWYLEVGSGAVAEAVRLATDPANYPIVYHCTAGKDRTGVVVALLLSCAGVERPAVVEDYAATEAAMPAILERLRQHPVFGADLANLPADRFTVRAETMAGFLSLVDDHYGGPLGWAASVGFGPDVAEQLAANLLEA